MLRICEGQTTLEKQREFVSTQEPAAEKLNPHPPNSCLQAILVFPLLFPCPLSPGEVLKSGLGIIFGIPKEFPGNAPPMRALPLAFLDDAAEREKLAILNADTTHPHPRALYIYIYIHI